MLRRQTVRHLSVGLLMTPILFGLLSGIRAEAQQTSFTFSTNFGGSVHQGSYRQNGFHDNASNVYTTGRAGGMFGSTTRRGYWSFDLSTLNTGGRPITSATLVLTRSGVVSSSGAKTLTVGLFDVSATVANLAAGYAVGSAPGTAIYTDLGTGNGYGSSVVSVGMGMPTDTLSIALNWQAIRDITNANGGFSIGAALLNPPPNDQYMFATFGNTPAATLIISTATPEPGAAALLLGLTGVGGGLLSMRRRSRRRFSSRAYSEGV